MSSARQPASPRSMADLIVKAETNDQRKKILDSVDPKFRDLVILMVNNEFELRKFRRNPAVYVR